MNDRLSSSGSLFHKHHILSHRQGKRIAQKCRVRCHNMGGPQFNTSTWVEVPGEISLIWLFVASSVRAISRAVSSVRVVSLSRSLVCVRLELDPKIRASMMCSSGFVNRHSSTRIRIFLTNESADSPGCCFRVLSLYLDSRKFLFGDKKFSKSNYIMNTAYIY